MNKKLRTEIMVGKIKRVLSKRGKLLLLTSIIVFSFLLSIYSFGENFKAKWWYIDDHEIMMFLGEDRRLGINEIPEILMKKTEVGDYGSYERYRPSYYSLRLAETSLWGDNPTLWYFSRILILTSFISILWYLTSKSIGYVKGLFFVTLVLSASYWAELISRLGPAETYAVLGAGLFLLGIYKLFFFYKDGKEIQKKTHILYLVLLTIGAIIGIGSKENLIILLIPTVLLSLFAILKKKMTLGLLISTIIIILYGAFVMSSIFIALSKTSTDIYGNNIGIRELVVMTLKHIPFVLKLFWIKWVVISTAILTIVVYKAKGILKLKEYIKKLAIFYFGTFTLIGLYLSQFFFYKGAWPTGMRYDFPGLLYYPFYLLVLFLLIKESLEILDVKKLIRENIYSVIIVLVFILVSPMQYFDYFKAYTKDNVVRTNAYTQTMENIVDVSIKNPSRPIFFESYSVWDYELVVSANRFLRAEGVKNDIYINVNSYSEESFTEPLQKKLAKEMISISKSGGSLVSESFVGREGNIPKRSGCITLNFSGITEDICNSFIIR